jgi:cation diffusion facilitator CzcD-associated flavoprotein CzcO
VHPDRADTDATAQRVFARWLADLAEAFATRDAAAFAGLFVDDAYWRDVLAFTWEHRTFAGPEAIRAAFAESAGRVRPAAARIAVTRSAPRLVARGAQVLIEGFFEFSTANGSGAGFVRLRADDSDPMAARAWLFVTTLQELDGFPERIGDRRPTGDEFSQLTSASSWPDTREREREFADRDPQVLIVGAGQSGLMLAARFKAMGVDALVVERTARVGDGWRARYKNLTLHNEIFANHFPYLPFPATWPLWMPKDMVADWLETYAGLLHLNVWTSVDLHGATYDQAAGRWTVTLDRAGTGPRTLHCSHLVIATGISGGPARRAELPGLDEFAGTVLHSSEFSSGAEWAGRRAIVIGTGNSGHDVAQDLHTHGAAVTLVQRSPTSVISLDPSARLHGSMFDDGRPVDDVDLLAAATPYPILIRSYTSLTRRMNALDADLIAGLNSVGFRTWDGEDATGFQLLYLRTGGGYYIDVGCCQLLIDGHIALAQAADIDRFVATGARMTDGSTMPADLVVLATGFRGIEDTVRTIAGDDVADRIGPAWGFDEDYVMRNMWRRTAQDGLWLMGGAIAQARPQSRFLALEIAAALSGQLPDRSHLPLVSRSPSTVPIG